MTEQMVSWLPCCRYFRGPEILVVRKLARVSECSGVLLGGAVSLSRFSKYDRRQLLYRKISRFN